MEFTQHSLDKLAIYGISSDIIVKEVNKAIHAFYDEKEQSQIKIISVKDKLLALVIDQVTDNLITVYRTDEKTINSRRRAKRWI